MGGSAIVITVVNKQNSFRFMGHRVDHPFLHHPWKIKYALGSLKAEDYVQWGLEQLLEGHDTPSLRILAGLHSGVEKDEVWDYFFKACQELNIEVPIMKLAPEFAASLILEVFEDGETSAEFVIGALATLYRRSGYASPLLGVWHPIHTKRTTHELGHYYPAEFYTEERIVSLNLDDTVRTEASLFRRGLLLNLPENFWFYALCEQCGYIGQLLGGKLSRDKSWQKSRCSQCDGMTLRSMSDPEVRSLYFSQLEESQCFKLNS